MIQEPGRVKIVNLKRHSLVLRTPQFFGKDDANNRQARLGIVIMVNHIDESVTIFWLDDQSEDEVMFLDMEHDFRVIPTMDIVGPYG